LGMAEDDEAAEARGPVGYGVKLDALKWESPVVGVRQKVHRGERRQLRLVEYSKGMALDWCERGHIGQILEGQLAIESARGTEILKAGDALLIPAGSAHKHRVTPLTTTATALFTEDVET
jgi:quercetin dioxygenase-like cupin family protein